MIVFSPDAASDIERLRTFLDEHDPGAAQRALSAIWTAMERLQEFPKSGLPTKDNAIRQIVVRFGSSGYVVRYSILPTNDILIIRIWHGREKRN